MLLLECISVSRWHCGTRSSLRCKPWEVITSLHPCLLLSSTKQEKTVLLHRLVNEGLKKWQRDQLRILGKMDRIIGRFHCAIAYFPLPGTASLICIENIMCESVPRGERGRADNIWAVNQKREVVLSTVITHMSEKQLEARVRDMGNSHLSRRSAAEWGQSGAVTSEKQRKERYSVLERKPVLPVTWIFDCACSSWHRDIAKLA